MSRACVPEHTSLPPLLRNPILGVISWARMSKRAIGLFSWLAGDEEHHPIPPDTCTASVNMIKSRAGHIDPAFSGGTFKASQTRTVSFASVP